MAQRRGNIIGVGGVKPKSTPIGLRFKNAVSNVNKATSQVQARIAQAQAQARAAQPASYGGGGGGGGSYGGGGGGGGGFASPVAAPAPRMSDADWLNADAQYNSKLAALSQRAKDFEIENASARTKGTADYQDSQHRLGWQNGAWNQEDRSTSYGNAYQGMMGDYASRGMLQSSLYDQGRTDMLANFNQQRTDMDTTHTNFLEDLARALAGNKSETQLGRDQARVDALARRAASEMGR